MGAGKDGGGMMARWLWVALSVLGACGGCSGKSRPFAKGVPEAPGAGTGAMDAAASPSASEPGVANGGEGTPTDPALAASGPPLAGAIGGPCALASDCTAPSQCVDGVCCTSSCTELCAACDLPARAPPSSATVTPNAAVTRARSLRPSAPTAAARAPAATLFRLSALRAPVASARRPTCARQTRQAKPAAARATAWPKAKYAPTPAAACARRDRSPRGATASSRTETRARAVSNARPALPAPTACAARKPATARVNAARPTRASASPSGRASPTHFAPTVASAPRPAATAD